MNSCRPAPFLEFMTKPLTVALEQTTVRADLFTHQMQLCPAGRKNSSVPGEVIAFFSPDISAERSEEVDEGAPRGGGARINMIVSCCMCEPVETAQSLGDDTHAVATQPKGSVRARTSFSVVLFASMIILGHRQVVEQGRGQK